MSDARRRSTPAWDPAVTVALLVAGVLQVTQTVALARTLDVTIAQSFAAQGLGTYTSGAVARGAGVAITVVSLVCLVLAIGFSVPRLRRRVPAFWVPLVCAAIWLLVTGLLVFAAMVADPAAMAAFTRR